ncbi:MAG: hypothetical protein H2049_00385 [Porphyrobacter sp.]|nr:hypothetical protein [Porphyrobacter sp.]
MNILLTIADLVLAFALFWHSANSPNRDPVLRAMLYAFAFAAMCFGAGRFLTLFDAARDEWVWMINLGHVALIAFGIMWVARETGRMAMLKGKEP